MFLGRSCVWLTDGATVPYSSANAGDGDATSCPPRKMLFAVCAIDRVVAGISMLFFTSLVLAVAATSRHCLKLLVSMYR
jgi:hypothetical protein